MTYRVFGGTMSPYSMKVRCYFEFKKIPFEWLPSGTDEYKKFAKLPIIPAVATPDNRGMQDSTPIIEEMEQVFPEPTIYPKDAMLRFISALLEEFGDEWGNKWMFHYRWAREVDCINGARRIVAGMMPPNASEDQIAKAAKPIQERMMTRGFAVGSNEKTAPLIEESFKNGLALLETHLASRPYLLGSRPSLGDFGLGHQVANCLNDVTAADILRTFPKVLAWAERMIGSKHPTEKPVDPAKVMGDFESWAALAPTLEPFLKTQVGPFLQWDLANAQALAGGKEEMTLDYNGKQWWQTVGGPQKYHAKSLVVIQKKYAEASAQSKELVQILERCGCANVLAGGGSKM